MPNSEKIGKVAELRRRIEGSEAILLTDYRGLTVADATELRRSLFEGGTRFAVVKNTLMQLAAAEARVQPLDALLQGPTAVAFVTGDPVGAAKKVVEAARRFPTLALKGAYMEGRVLSAEDAQALATLESREAMLAKVAGLAKGEMSRAAGMFQALQARFLSLLEAYRGKLPSVDSDGSEEVEDAAAMPSVTETAEAKEEGDAAPVAASAASEEAFAELDDGSNEAEASDQDGKE